MDTEQQWFRFGHGWAHHALYVEAHVGAGYVVSFCGYEVPRSDTFDWVVGAPSRPCKVCRKVLEAKA